MGIVILKIYGSLLIQETFQILKNILKNDLKDLTFLK